MHGFLLARRVGVRANGVEERGTDVDCAIGTRNRSWFWSWVCNIAEELHEIDVADWIPSAVVCMYFLNTEGEEDAFPMVIVWEMKEQSPILEDTVVFGESAFVALVLDMGQIYATYRNMEFDVVGMSGEGAGD